MLNARRDASRSGLELEDMDLIEIHEAFGAQVLANAAAWEQGWKGKATSAIDWDKVNVRKLDRRRPPMGCDRRTHRDHARERDGAA